MIVWAISRGDCLSPLHRFDQKNRRAADPCFQYARMIFHSTTRLLSRVRSGR